MSMFASVLLLAYLPGLVLFRLPVASRDRRASLPPEERVFWYVVISLATTSIVALSLAAVDRYSFEALLWTNGLLSVLFAIGSRGRLTFGQSAGHVTRATAIPVLLGALSFTLVFFVPPAEYVMGGKDPGTYMNEGIQIAQRGSLEVSDSLVASVPPAFWSLFFPERDNPTYYSNRFMGFFLVDPDDGAVIGQFPHLYPVWIAIGYGANGLSGARYVIGLWAVLGVLAVYFSAVWLVGRPAAAAGAALLAVHVAQVWYGRYPNAELIMQVLLFSSLLAFSRASVDDDRFFAPVAALLVTLSLFAHFTSVLAVAALAGVSLLGIIHNRRPQTAFLVPLVGGTVVAMLYFATLLEPYFYRPIRFVRYLSLSQLALIALGVAAAFGLLWTARHEAIARRVRALLPDRPKWP